MSIQPNTTCDIYRTGHAPPAAPDVAAVPCFFIACFDVGRERGEKEGQQYRFTARMLVAPATDVRDDFNAWTGTASNRDTVYIPNQSGIGYNVNFVERINRGLPGDALCVYLDRLAILWPYPGPAVISVSPDVGSTVGGTTVTITGRGFTGATAVAFGVVAAAGFTVNSDTQITAQSPAESVGTVDVTVTTPLGTSTKTSADQFTYEATVATPTFSPAAGAYGPTQSVTISCATSGASIYYTTDGSTPTTSSTLYSGAVSVSVNETIKAIGVKTGDLNSAVGSAAYVINGAVATPTFSPAAGYYSSSQSVSISCSTPGAAIYYTTDGTTPTAGSTLYTGPITVATGELIQAIGVLAGYANSSVGSASYAIGGSQVFSTPGTTTFTVPYGITSITIKATGGGAGTF